MTIARCLAFSLRTTSATARREELETALADAFLDMLDMCILTMRDAVDYPPGVPSYNVLLEGPAKVLKNLGCESVHKMQVSGGPELPVDGDAGIPWGPLACEVSFLLL